MGRDVLKSRTSHSRRKVLYQPFELSYQVRESRTVDTGRRFVLPPSMSSLMKGHSSAGIAVRQQSRVLLSGWFVEGKKCVPRGREEFHDKSEGAGAPRGIGPPDRWSVRQAWRPPVFRYGMDEWTPRRYSDPPVIHRRSEPSPTFYTYRGPPAPVT